MIYRQREKVVSIDPHSLEGSLERFLLTKVSHQTRRVYRAELIFFFRTLKKAIPTLVNLEDLLWYHDLISYLKPATRLRKLVTLNQYFKYLEKAGLIKENPVEELPLPKVFSSTPKALNYKQAKDLLSVVDRSTLIGKRDYAIIYTMLRVGLRVGEVVRMDYEDFLNKDGYRLLLVHGKGEREEEVKILKDVWEVLEEYRLAGGGDLKGPIFWATVCGVCRKPQRISAVTIFKRVKHYVGLAGLPSYIGPHSLRHTFAYLTHQAGADVLQICEALRHSDLRTTHTYLKRLNRFEQSAFDLTPTF